MTTTTMRIAERYRRLTGWNKLGVWGAVASIAGLVLAVFVLLVPRPTENQTPSPSGQQRFKAAAARVLSAGPVAASAGHDGDGNVEVIGHGFSEATYSTRQRGVRIQRGLRELSELESGRPLTAMPKGAFGFVDLVDFLSGASHLQSTLPRVRIRRFSVADRFGDQPFEVESRSGHEPALLGFSTETGAVAVSTSETTRLVLSARPHGDLTTLVSIGMSRLAGMVSRLIEVGPGKSYFVMDFDVR